MSSASTASANTAVGGSTAPATGNTGGSTNGQLSNAYGSQFTIPSGFKLEQFDGTGWAEWSDMIEAIITLQEAEDIITLDSPPTGFDQPDWDSIQRRTKAYLRLYTKTDVYSLISSNTDYPTFKSKWNKLKETYGGVSGSTTVFNLWRQFSTALLSDTEPMTPQLTKLNQLCSSLTNASMGVTDTQYCLVLLNALPDSYEVLASTILASGLATTLKHTEIIAWIINEEGRRAGGSLSLNAAKAAPIKSAGGKKKQCDHLQLTCHYCNKKGHIKPNCCKKKQDEKEQKEKAGGGKAANVHAKIENTA